MRRVTKAMVVSVLLLVAFGLVMLYSVSPVSDSTRYLERQLIACGLGLAGAVVLAAIDYRHLRWISAILLCGAVGLLAAVLHYGVEVNGARRWFRFFGFQFQPSDFAKLALVVALAHYGAWRGRSMQTLGWGVVVPLVGVGVVVGLIFAEPDWGTGLLLAAVSGVILVVAGVRWEYVLPPAAVGVLGVGAMLAIDPMRSGRIYSWLHLEETKAGIGYQVYSGRTAMALGAVTGVGLNQSTRKAYVPEHRTDFIYAIVGEEFGLVGALGVWLGFLVFFVCGLTMAWRAPDSFGLLLGTGLTFLVTLQAFINMGVVTGFLPNKGLALPFISYGGSNLTMMLACSGVLVSIGRRAQEAPMVEPPTVRLPPLSVTRLA